MLFFCRIIQSTRARQVATVTSASKMENEQQFQIAKKLQELTGAFATLGPSLPDAVCLPGSAPNL